jgi:hypothetical protein
MFNKQAKEIAEQYLREQAKIIGKYGHAPKLSGDRYREALSDTQKIFQALSTSPEVKSKE